MSQGLLSLPWNTLSRRVRISGFVHGMMKETDVTDTAREVYTTTAEEPGETRKEALSQRSGPRSSLSSSTTTTPTHMERTWSQPGQTRRGPPFRETFPWLEYYLVGAHQSTPPHTHLPRRHCRRIDHHLYPTTRRTDGPDAANKPRAIRANNTR